MLDPKLLLEREREDILNSVGVQRAVYVRKQHVFGGQVFILYRSANEGFVDKEDYQILLAPKITVTDVCELFCCAAMYEAVLGKGVGSIGWMPRRLFPLG